MPGKTIKKTSNSKVGKVDVKSTKCTKAKVFYEKNHITKSGKKRLCKQTSGGLKKADLALNYAGEVVSVNKQKAYKKGPLSPKSRGTLIEISGILSNAKKSKLLGKTVTDASVKAARLVAKSAKKAKIASKGASKVATRSMAKKGKK